VNLASSKKIGGLPGSNLSRVTTDKQLDELIDDHADWPNALPEETMNSILCQIDDKHIPLYRIMWVADLPHFCGHEDCEKEGRYEVRLEQDESVWAVSLQERDELLAALEKWRGGLGSEPGQDW